MSTRCFNHKKFNSLDRSTYPSDPKQRNRLKAMSTWDAMKEVAKEEARKGNYKDLRELKKIFRVDIFPSSGLIIPQTRAKYFLLML